MAPEQTGTPDRIVTRQIDSPVGRLLLGTREGERAGLCLLEFDHPKRTRRALSDLERLLGARIEEGDGSLLDETEHQLRAYFAGDRTSFDLPLDSPGTDFQRRVWTELLNIPHGETITYGELARRVGDAGAARAVGAANGANRLAIVIPCHRVIDSNGRLHGYGGGLDRKKWLLEHEGALKPEATLF